MFSNKCRNPHFIIFLEFLVITIIMEKTDTLSEENTQTNTGREKQHASIVDQPREVKAKPLAVVVRYVVKGLHVLDPVVRIETK
jgi:hypothetical protein